ncbi:hypothetical protein NGM99_11230 [Mesorhizobium sp. RP14(2022)]|uniref:Uncharacterized protein n=1 Tax=Mesorhizobium liriopis TaxID=2953882 RepID=A0ABT1C883_9HYPH|nr:hypothetical protein [Mesorhizobium liriopis]
MVIVVTPENFSNIRMFGQRMTRGERGFANLEAKERISLPEKAEGDGPAFQRSTAGGSSMARRCIAIVQCAMRGPHVRLALHAELSRAAAELAKHGDSPCVSSEVQLSPMRHNFGRTFFFLHHANL